MRKSLLLCVALLAISSIVSAQVLTIEAEDYSRISGAFQLVVDNTVGGDGTAVVIPNNAVLTANDMVQYSFRVNQNGTYYFRGRALAPTGGDDSFCVRIEEADGTLITPLSADCAGTGLYWDFWASAAWQEMDLMNGWNGNQATVYFNLTAGETYTITLLYREDGLFLDWLKLYRSLDALPVYDATTESAEDESALAR